MLREVPQYRCAYTHVTNAQADAIDLLVGWLAPTTARDLTIVGPTMSSLDDSPVLTRLIKSGAGRESAGKGHPRIGDAGLVLAMWLTDEMLARVESSRLKALAVGPWNLDEIEVWRRTHKPVELTGVAVAEAQSTMNSVVREGVVSLVEMSNPANGLSGYNRDQAVQGFAALFKAGFSWDPVDVAAIYAQGGWRLDGAREVAELSKQILAGKALRGNRELRSDIVDTWRQDVEEGRTTPWPPEAK